MFNYKRRMLISVAIASLFTISLFIYNYYRNTYLVNYNFVCMVGSLSDEEPEKINHLLKSITTNSPSPSLYQKGLDTLASLGYGKKGYTYFRRNYSEDASYIILCSVILLFIFLMEYYVQHPLLKIRKMVTTLTLDIEHAMTKYPINFETRETNVMVLNRLAATITSLTERLNHQIDLLKKTQDDRTVFIENISHQIKTPLACISLDLELLENVTDPTKIAVYTSSCYTQIDHIEALINRLLKIGKLESGKIHYEFLEHNLLDTLSVLSNTLEGQYPDKKVTLFYDKSCDYIISYDIVWMYEALENITRNCCLYSYDNEGIEIHLVRYESYIKIVLCDHGIGIPEEDLPNIFDRFYRSKQNLNQEGFGIGLNLAKLVIEGHHGTIFALSDNRSTQFIIHLPLII